MYGDSIYISSGKLISEPWSPFLAQSPLDILQLNPRTDHLLYECSRFGLARTSVSLPVQSLMQRSHQRGTRSSFQARLSSTGTRRADHLMWIAGTVQASCPSHGFALSSKHGGQNVLKTCRDEAWSTGCRSLLGSWNPLLQLPQTTRFAGDMQMSGTCRDHPQKVGFSLFSPYNIVHSIQLCKMELK